MSGMLINISASTSSNEATISQSKVDALSRDDLIRFVKKQINKLKTAKCENEKLKIELAEIQKDFTKFEKNLCDEQEKNKEKEEEIRLLNEKCNDLKTECSELTLQLEKLKMKSKKFQEVNATSSMNQSSEPNSELNENDRMASYNVQLQNELVSIKDLLRKQTEECNKQADEKEKMTYTIAELRSLLDDAYAQLESYKEKRSVENVITLEIADFEKTVERLQKELKATNLEKFSLRSELEATTKKMDNILQEKVLLTDNTAKLNAAVKDLEKEIEEKKAELALHEKEREDLKEQLQKQVSVQSNEREQLITVIGTNEKKIEDLEALNASLNRQLMSSCSQCKSLQRQLDDLFEEHSTFKTRALYVLEQKKSDDDERRKGEIEILEETIRQQKNSIDNLTKSHHMLQDELDSSSGHVRTLSAEISNLQRQLNTAIESHKRELSEQRREFDLRIVSETKLNKKLLAQIDANSVLHNQEKENLLATARQDREDLEKEMECLRHALNEEVERRTKMEKIQVAVAQNVAIQLQKSSADILPSSTYLNHATREAAVAADKSAKNDDDEAKCEEKSLEEVIYGEFEELTITDIWNQPDNSITQQDVTEMITKQLKHTRELLNESEATNVRLLEQTKLLKDEIRRIERDRERENHLANTEYLKDVIMKFIAPEKVTDERGYLIPVLTTMLKLSNDEVNLLSQVAEADAVTNKTTASTWKNYIWSALP
ncbi:GRIP and coiled-coil domain-containing protein [Dirofilaria immitis]